MRQTMYAVVIILFLVNFSNQRTIKMSLCVGQRLPIYYNNLMTNSLCDNQPYFWSRDYACNRQEENEVLSKSKKDKILVTQKD